MDFEGIHNFRDYGGYAGKDSRRVRRGVLFRSAQHIGATPQDLDRLAALKLRTVVDLRGAAERQMFPCKRHDGFEAQVLFFDGETAGGWAPHDPTVDGPMDAAAAHARMAATYQHLPFGDGLVYGLRLYLNALAERDGASLVHCFAGKDRTGIAVALLHHALGVDPDDAMHDYLLTNTSGAVERGFEAAAAGMRARWDENITDEAIRVFLGVHETYLANALAAIKARHGSIDGYLEQVVGVDAATREALAERLLQ